MYRLPIIIAYILNEVTSLCHGRETTVPNCPTFLGRFGTCADNAYQALSPRPSEHGGGDPGNEARCPHETSHCINIRSDVTKRWHLCISLNGESAQAHILFFYFRIVECASCIKVINKLNKVFW